MTLHQEKCLFTEKKQKGYEIRNDNVKNETKVVISAKLVNIQFVTDKWSQFV